MMGGELLNQQAKERQRLSEGRGKKGPVLVPDLKKGDARETVGWSQPKLADFITKRTSSFSDKNAKASAEHGCTMQPRYPISVCHRRHFCRLWQNSAGGFVQKPEIGKMNKSPSADDGGDRPWRFPGYHRPSFPRRGLLGRFRGRGDALARLCLTRWATMIGWIPLTRSLTTQQQYNRLDRTRVSARPCTFLYKGRVSTLSGRLRILLGE